MRRRDFITLLGGAAVAWPLAARAQQMPVIGFLSSRSPSESTYVVAAFRQGLREVGYVEGQNLIIAFRWAEGRYDQLPALAADLVSLPVAVLFAAGGSPSALAAKSATSAIPIVFSAVADPVGLGLVTSLSRPGGNLTGMSVFTYELWSKRLEALRQLAPSAAVIAALVNPAVPTAEPDTRELRAAAKTLGLELHVIGASNERSLTIAFTKLVELRAAACLVQGDPFLDGQRDRLVESFAQHAIPASYAWRENVVAGGLMSYGTSIEDSYQQAGRYTGRILKGEKPSDLPVMQPTKFHLALNLKTAKALGLEIPPMLLARADEVIE
jgi:putative tryptophan/tyrosine transport system substrate-binding protein